MDEATIRRLVAMGLAVLVPFAEKLLKAEIDPQVLVALEAAIAAYILGSNYKQAAVVKAETAAANVKTVEDAAAVLAPKPPEVKP